MLNYDTVLTLLIVGIATIAIRYLDKLIAPRLNETVHGHYQDEIARLEEELQAVREKHEAEIKEIKEKHAADRQAMQEQIRFLLTELADARNQIVQLQTTKRDKVTVEPKRKQSVLLIYGDAAFGDNDRNALQRAGADFVTMREATKDMIRRRLQRAREDDDPFRYVHVAAHGTDDFIKLMDGPADGKWWNDVLVGVEIVFLAACHSAGVADWLAGPGRAVVELDSAATDEAAYMFTYLFWRAIIGGRTASEAFQQARTELPSIADQVSIRGTTSGKQ